MTEYGDCEKKICLNRQQLLSAVRGVIRCTVGLAAVELTESLANEMADQMNVPGFIKERPTDYEIIKGRVHALRLSAQCLKRKAANAALSGAERTDEQT